MYQHFTEMDFPGNGNAETQLWEKLVLYYIRQIYLNKEKMKLGKSNTTYYMLQLQFWKSAPET